MGWQGGGLVGGRGAQPGEDQVEVPQVERGGTFTGDGDPCTEVFEQQRDVGRGEVGPQSPCPVRASHQVMT